MNINKEVYNALENLQLRLAAVKSFADLTSLKHDAARLEREAQSAAPAVSSFVYRVERIEIALENDFDAHPFGWAFAERFKRVY